MSKGDCNTLGMVNETAKGFEMTTYNTKCAVPLFKGLFLGTPQLSAVVVYHW